MRKLVIFRILQLFRLLMHFGIIISIIVSSFVWAVLFAIYTRINEVNFFLWLIIPLVLISKIHFKRKDILFLYKTELPIRKIFFFEYFLLLLPFTIMLASHFLWLEIITLNFSLLISFIIPRINKTKIIYKKKEHRGLSIINYQCFEIKSAIRKNIILFLTLYLFGLLSWIYDGIIVLFFLIIIGNIPTLFYYVEPKEIIQAGEKYLKRKIILNLITINLILLPIYLVCLFSKLNLLFLLIAIPFIVLTIIFSILVKYANCHPSEKKVNNTIIIMIFILILFIPAGGIFVNGFLLYKYHKHAKNNLRNYYA